MEIMEEFKGTKQEWIVLTDSTGAQQGLICRTLNKPTKNEACANAKLIAAAPEMLKALLETDKDLCVLEGNMAQIEKTDPRAEGMTALVTGWRTRNKEVINKALGL